ADACIEQATMNEKRDADKASGAGNATDTDRHPLLGGVRDPNPIEHPDRRQQADEMPHEDQENADVEQIGTPHQLPTAQELARSATPRVLLAVEANPIAHQEDGKAEIRVPSEHDVIDEFAHGQAPCADAGRRAARMREIRVSLQDEAPGPKLTGSSSQA